MRRFDPADGPDVLRCASRLTTGVAPWRDPVKVAAAARRWVSASVEAAGNEAHAVFVALVDGRIAGVVTVREHEHWAGEVDAHVDELVTAEEFEGLGVGRSLVSVVEAWARERGLANVTLETGIRNARARAFYERAGFEEEEVVLTKRVAPEPGTAVGGSHHGAPDGVVRERGLEDREGRRTHSP